MNVYIFTVVITDHEAQDVADHLREVMIDNIPEGVEVHVTESVRVIE